MAQQEVGKVEIWSLLWDWGPSRHCSGPMGKFITLRSASLAEDDLIHTGEVSSHGVDPNLYYQGLFLGSRKNMETARLAKIVGMNAGLERH